MILIWVVSSIRFKLDYTLTWGHGKLVAGAPEVFSIDISPLPQFICVLNLCIMQFGRGFGPHPEHGLKKIHANWPPARSRHSTSSRLLLVFSRAADVYKHADPRSIFLQPLPSNITMAITRSSNGREGVQASTVADFDRKKKGSERDAASATWASHDA